MVLYPPWQKTLRGMHSKDLPLPSCYAPLWKPPEMPVEKQIEANKGLDDTYAVEVRLDGQRLLLQCLPVALLAGLGWVLLRD
jgi:hypothetical protein